MSITLNLSPEVEKGLMAQARQRGIPLSDYLQEIVTRQACLAAGTSTGSKDKARAFELWARSHRATPLLSDDAVSRASLIREN
jgi:hypothetical protein